MTLVDTEAFDDQNNNSLLQAELARKSASRRDMLRGLSVGAVAALGGTLAAGCGGGTQTHLTPIGGGVITPSTPNNGPTRGVARDIDILNFALNLEYLEAEFYSYATTGAGIETQGVAITGQNGTTGTTIAAGTTTGGAKVSFDTTGLATVAAQLAFDERTHVNYLRAAITGLGGQPVARPNINLAALLPAGINIGTVNGFLMASRAFEDTGVSAYGGAAQFIYNSDILRAASRVLAVEAYHAANIRLQIAQRGLTSPATDGLDVPPPPTGSLYFAVEPINALAIIRTPRQVLNIVVAAPASNPNATTGGFFPSGVNANLLTLTSLA